MILFMYGIHKSTIWFWVVWHKINYYTYTKGNQAYKGALTFGTLCWKFFKTESTNHELGRSIGEKPILQIGLTAILISPSLPDVGLDHSIIARHATQVPSTPYKHHHQ
jgi:hypothetical protein